MMDTHYFLQPTHFCILKYELLKSFTIKEKCEGTSKHIYPNIRQVLYSPEKKKNLSKWILIIYIYIYIAIGREQTGHKTLSYSHMK